MAFSLETVMKMRQKKAVEIKPEQSGPYFVPPEAPHPPGATPGEDNMPCPDCGGRKVDVDGEACEMCAGTGVVPQFDCW